MLEEFYNYIEKNALFIPNEKIIIGASGGIDSMLLCDLFLKSGFKFGIAHCNFNLRANESDGDEQFVESYAKLHNIPYHVIHFDTIEYANENNISIQMAARDLRYNWFNELINTYGYSKLAVAHHADDNIETFFINLTRGAGLNGLCGIPVKNQLIIRPLLFATRQQITEYANKQGLSHREDSSNAVDKYARNRIRLNVIPELDKINPSFRHTMLNNLQHLQDVQSFVESEMQKIAVDICFEKSGHYYVTIEKLKTLNHLELFLHSILQKFGFKNEAIKQIAATLNGTSGKQFNTHTHTLLKDRDYLIVSPCVDNIDTLEYPININDSELTNPLHLAFKQIEKISSFEPCKDTAIAQFDFDKLKFPLTLRKWQHGDSFVPFGMKGHKKLSNYFSDNKYSLLDKQNQWILASGSDIIWLVGKRIDNRFKVDDNTQKIWQIQLVNNTL